MKILKHLHNPLFLSLAGNIAMILARMLYIQDLFFSFMLWNLFLAAVPLLISRKIYRKKNINRPLLYSSLFIWLLFLPNAPYIVTDLVHLYHRPPVPFWFDMLLVLLSVINGLVLGFVSIHQIEQLFRNRNAQKYLPLFRITIMLIMSYGVYLGRYLRFNSWDAIINPHHVLRGVYDSITIGTVGFVLTFGFVSFVLYSFYKSILRQRY